MKFAKNMKWTYCGSSRLVRFVALFDNVLPESDLGVLKNYD